MRLVEKKQIGGYVSPEYASYLLKLGGDWSGKNFERLLKLIEAAGILNSLNPYIAEVPAEEVPLEPIGIPTDTINGVIQSIYPWDESPNGRKNGTVTVLRSLDGSSYGKEYQPKSGETTYENEETYKRLKKKRL